MSLKDLIFNDSGKNKKDVDKATKTQSQPSGQGDGAVFRQIQYNQIMVVLNQIMVTLKLME